MGGGNKQEYYLRPRSRAKVTTLLAERENKEDTKYGRLESRKKYSRNNGHIRETSGRAQKLRSKEPETLFDSTPLYVSRKPGEDSKEEEETKTTKGDKERPEDSNPRNMLSRRITDRVSDRNTSYENDNEENQDNEFTSAYVGDVHNMRIQAGIMINAHPEPKRNCARNESTR